MSDFTIKIGRIELVVHPGEYFLDNGSCLQFITDDDARKKYIVSGLARWYTFLIVPKKREHCIKENKRFEKRPSKQKGAYIYVLKKQ